MILDKIDKRIAIVEANQVREQLIDLGNRGKKLDQSLYTPDGAYKDLTIEELQELREQALLLIGEWQEFYLTNKTNPVLVKDGVFTDECMVCNDYIMHANEFDVQ